VLQGACVVAGLASLYFWLQGLLEIRAARREPASLLADKSFGALYLAKPEDYFGRGRDSVLRAQRSWRLMLISGFIAALLGGLWQVLGN
jgi:hypothetical protein